MKQWRNAFRGGARGNVGFCFNENLLFDVVVVTSNLRSLTEDNKEKRNQHVMTIMFKILT